MNDGNTLGLKKAITFSLTAITLFLLLVLSIGEVGCRIVMWWKHGVPGKSYGIYQSDDELGAVHRPHSYNSNSVMNNYGLRNEEDVSERKQPGSKRVYCSGGSTTFCYNLYTNEAWPSVTQAMIRKEPGHERDEILNGGEICFSIGHEFALAKRLIPALKPDYVILFTGVNEGMMGDQFAALSPTKLDELLANKSWGVPPTNLDQARFWKRNSALVRLWDYYGKKLFEKQATAEFRNQDVLTPPEGAPSMHPYIMENLDHTLRAYIQFIRANGAIPVVLRFGDSGNMDWYTEHGIRKWREKAVAVARSLNVEVCDVAAVMEGRPDRKDCFITSGVHVTKLGAEVMAAEIAKTLLKLSSASK
jgi:lysophospholipase L1-like esterase